MEGVLFPVIFSLILTSEGYALSSRKNCYSKSERNPFVAWPIRKV